MPELLPASVAVATASSQDLPQTMEHLRVLRHRLPSAKGGRRMDGWVDATYAVLDEISMRRSDSSRLIR